MNHSLIHYIYLKDSTTTTSRKWGFLMKTTLITIIALCSSFVYAARTDEQTVITCSNQRSESFQISMDWGAIGTVNYNYSSANVVCSQAFENILTQVGVRNCFGVWSFDLDRAANKVIDTPAQVEVTNNGRALTARFLTNKLYGSQMISLKCQVTKEKRPSPSAEN